MDKAVVPALDMILVITFFVKVGRACFVRLNQQLQAKLGFTSQSLNIADHYNALRVRILNRQVGKVDASTLRFSKIRGHRKWFENVRSTRIYGSTAESRSGMDTSRASELQTLSDAAGAYLEVSQNQEQTAAQRWGQTV